jgi:hypothetical protein
VFLPNNKTKKYNYIYKQVWVLWFRRKILPLLLPYTMLFIF